MRKETFFEKIKEKVSEYYEGRAVVSVHDVMKNNGSQKHGICVTRSESNCGPTIYMDDMYDSFKEGRSVNEIVEDIISIFEEHAVNEQVDLSFFRVFDQVRPNICFKLISGERNAELLKDIPNRRMSDLAIVYYVSLEFLGVDGSILIRNEHIDMWKTTEEDLYEAAIDNTPEKMGSSFMPMAAILESMMPDGFEDEGVRNCGLYVATNEKKIYGASVILYPGFLKEAAAFFGDSFYILPSSVHEVILLKDNHEANVSEIGDIVKSVNSSCVSDEDYLSDSVYYYDTSDPSSENNVKKVEYAGSTMLL